MPDLDPTHVVLLTGVEPDPMAVAMVALVVDLPHAVAVRHHIDVDAQVLHRVVSDITGILEREEIPLDHACASCALREDVLPTLRRLADDGRWTTIVAQLPVGAGAEQVCHVLALEASWSRRLRVASVVTALAGSSLLDDLLGDLLLRERGHHTAEDDARGVGEVACAMVEHADLVVVAGDTSPVGLDLLRTLARPGALVVPGVEHLEGSVAVSERHHHPLTRAWSDPLRPLGALGPQRASERVWTVDLGSPRAFHPHRLRTRLDELGGGRHRSRGCFWLPTRPGDVLVWDGSGGQLSIGTRGTWARRTPYTHLSFVGAGSEPAHLTDSFGDLLLAHDEVWRPGHREDGFERWLGPIRTVA